jgi:DNA-binding response OmpR family regulator
MMKRVLIVDDEIAGALALGLKSCENSGNIEFHTASDGEQCLTMVESLSPDLVLLDIGLPIIDGMTLLSEFRRRRIKTRIIMMSGYKTDLNTAIECVKAGACDYVVKGEVEPEALLNRIKRALLVESTLNVRISRLPASARSLIEEASRLKDDYERLKLENENLQKRVSNNYRRLMLETAQKTLYALLAAGCVFLLNWLGIVQATIILPIVFVVLLILLLVPSDKIQSISASISDKIKGQINMNPPTNNDTRQ